MDQQESKQPKGVGVAIVIVVVILVGGVVLFTTSADSRECQDRARAAAVDNYPINEYPDTAERGGLQEQYKQRYITDNCQ